MNNRISIIRDSIGKVVRMLSEKNIEITQRGSNAYVRYDEKTGEPVQVNLPYIPDDASDTFINAVQGFLDHEVAHILFSDPKAIAEAKRRGNETQELHNLIEDSFIERQMTRRFSGSGVNLRNVGEFFLKEYTDKQIAAHPGEAVSFLAVPAVRAWSGSTVFADYMKDKWHMMKPMTDLLGSAVDEVKDCQSSWDCLALAEKFKELLGQEQIPPQPGGEGDSSDDGESKDKGKPSKGKNKISKKDKEKSEEKSKDKSDESEGSGSDSESDSGSDNKENNAESENLNNSSSEDNGSNLDDDTGESGKDSGKNGSGSELPYEGSSEGESDGGFNEDSSQQQSGTNNPLHNSASKFDLDSFTEHLQDYDEVVSKVLSQKAEEEMANSDYVIFSTDFDKIEPIRKSSKVNSSVIEQMEKSVDHMVGPLQKDLERLIAAKSKIVWTPGYRSGRLNASALAKLVTFNDDRAFRRKQESTSKDVAVSLLVDCSGSMGGTKIQTAAYAAYALSSVLCRIGIPNEVLGFTTHNIIPDPAIYNSKVGYARIESLYIPIIKTYQERMLPDIKKRFASLTVAGWLNNNIDGESVRIAANRLAPRKEARKILIVLSDGSPAAYDANYHALNRHLKDTVKDIEKSGIDVLGIGIQSDEVEKFYSKHIILNNVRDLPMQVMGEMKRLLIKN